VARAHAIRLFSLVFLALPATACGSGLPLSSGALDTSCAGEQTRPISETILRSTLARHHITVRADPEAVICGTGDPAEDMPVELTNLDDEGLAEAQGNVFCGLRRGPIWGSTLEKDLDAPASSPIFSGEKAEFSVANVECSVYPRGPESGKQVRNLERAMEELARLAR